MKFLKNLIDFLFKKKEKSNLIETEVNESRNKILEKMNIIEENKENKEQLQIVEAKLETERAKLIIEKQSEMEKIEKSIEDLKIIYEITFQKLSSLDKINSKNLFLIYKDYCSELDKYKELDTEKLFVLIIQNIIDILFKNILKTFKNINGSTYGALTSSIKQQYDIWKSFCLKCETLEGVKPKKSAFKKALDFKTIEKVTDYQYIISLKNEVWFE